MSVLTSPAFLRALAVVFGAAAIVLNGHVDATSIGELVLALLGVGSLVKAEVSAHAAQPADETHPAPAPVGEP